jgi:hypothetical protein
MSTEKGRIERSKKKEGTVGGAQKPSWIADKENQRKWNAEPSWAPEKLLINQQYSSN